MKTQNRRYPRSSGMDGNKSGESGAFLLNFFPTCPRFLRWWEIFLINQNSNLHRRGRRPWISLIANPLHPWAPVLYHINIASLGQTCGDYPIHWQNLGRSAKSKISDRLRFSRHMKTKLYAEESFLLRIY